MIAPRLIARDEWERLLRNDHGCRPFAGGALPPISTGEHWETTAGGLFIVPCDLQGLLRADDLQHVLANIARLKLLDLDG